MYFIYKITITKSLIENKADGGECRFILAEGTTLSICKLHSIITSSKYTSLNKFALSTANKSDKALVPRN